VATSNATPRYESPDKFTLGMVGLGRMGANLARRAIRDGHAVIGYDSDASLVNDLANEGAGTSSNLVDLVSQLPCPRIIWIMVPAGAITNAVIEELMPLLDSRDCIIDGGNSYYRDDIAHAAALSTKGIEFIDVGTSGGVWGLDRGFSLMIGGSDTAVDRLTGLWDSLAPGLEAVKRTNPDTPVSPAESGWLHCGPSGAGHFVKMIHNGIEYAIMAAYAEGLNVLKHANVGSSSSAQGDAETAPLMDPDMYQYDFNIAEIAEVWRRGSVIGSWLLDLTASALRESPELESFSGRVSDSGEGRWTSIAAIEEGVPTPVLTSALYSRFASQGNDRFANQVLSAMRLSFGGHQEKN
jgi:6-phosphogluconate dehydrogenase